MKFKISILTVALACFVPFVSSASVLRAQSAPKAQRKVASYSCPMHPEVTSGKRGRCPKCGMTLRPVTEPVAATVAAPEPSSPPPPISSDSPPRVPDVAVVDQNGKRLNFYSDLVKGKTVAINFVFTTCTTICTPLTATFRRVQQELAAQSLPVQLISVSVDPV